MEDMTGKPRSDEDIQDAINCINTIMVKHATVLPLLTVHAGIIREGLIELLQRRHSELTKERG